MKHLAATILLLAGLLAPGPLAAQNVVFDELDARRPDEASPFFTDQETARALNSQAGRDRLAARRVAKYPDTAGYDSAPNQIGRFFGTMFSSVRLGPDRGITSAELVIEPADFALEDRREINVHFTVTNTTRRMQKLEFPSDQRIEIVIRDAQGGVIERWSDDRVFAETAGVVAINPEERVEYSERIPTREMEPGNTYTIEASVVGHPEYTSAVRITPR